MYKVNENQHIQPYLEELLPSAHLPDKASLSYNDEIRTRCASNFSQFQISAGFSEKKSQGIRTEYPPTNFQGNSFMGLSTGDIAVAAEPSATSRQMLVTENHHQDVNHLYSRSNFVENYFQGEKKLIPSQYREEHSHDLNLNMSHPLHNDNISIYGTDNPATSLLANQQSPPPFCYSNESVQEFQPLQMPFHPIYQDDHITNNQQYHQVPLEYHHHHYVTDHSLMNYHPHSQFFHIQSYHEIKNAKKETSENYNYYQQHSERIVEKVKEPSRPKEIRRSSSSSSKYKSEKLSQPPPGLMALQADGIYTPKVIMHKKPIKKPVKANDGRVCVVCSTDNPSSWRRVENSWYCRRCHNHYMRRRIAILSEAEFQKNPSLLRTCSKCSAWRNIRWYKNPDEPSLFICGKCYEINRKGTKIRYENHESGYQYKSDHLGDDFESSELKCAHIYSAETISDTLPFSAFSGQV